MKTKFTSVLADFRKSDPFVNPTVCRGLAIARDRSLRVASRFAPVPAAAGLRPLTAFAIGSERYILLSDAASTLHIGRAPLASDSDLTAIGSLHIPGKIVSAHADDSIVSLMILDADGSPSVIRVFFASPTIATILPDPSEYPALALRSEGAGTFTSTVPARRVNLSNYGSGLSRTEFRNLCNDYAEAYLSLASQVNSAGAFLQPALVRYRFLDSAGATIFESMPVLLSRDMDGTSQFVSYLQRSISLDGEVAETQLSGSAWRLTPTIPADFWTKAPDVARIEILASPEFHPYHPDETPSFISVRRPSSFEASVALPGNVFGINPDSKTAPQRLSQVTAAFSSSRTGHVIATFRRGEFPEDSATFGPATTTMTIPKQIRAVDSAITAAIATVNPDNLRLFRFPNRIWAARFARDAAIVVGANLYALRAAPYLPSVMSVETDSNPSATWRASVAVTLADGAEILVANETGHGHRPAALSPVISYPDPEARSLNVRVVDSQGKIYENKFPLTPCGSIAAYVEPSFKPINLKPSNASNFENFTPIVQPHHLPDGIAIWETLSLQSCKAVIRTGTNLPAIAVATLSGVSGSRDYGRHRFIVGDNSALYILTTTETSHGLRRILNIGIQRRDALCEAGDRGVFAALGPDGSTVLNISSTAKTTLPVCSPGGTFVAFSIAGQTLLTGNGTCLELLHQREHVDLSAIKAYETWNIDGQILFTDNDGQILVESDLDTQADTQFPIEWEASIDTEKPRPEEAILNIRASCANLTIQFLQNTHASVMPPINTTQVKGPVIGPIRIPLLPRRATTGAIILRLTGTLSPDATLRTITI